MKIRIRRAAALLLCFLLAVSVPAEAAEIASDESSTVVSETAEEVSTDTETANADTSTDTADSSDSSDTTDTAEAAASTEENAADAVAEEEAEAAQESGAVIGSMDELSYVYIDASIVSVGGEQNIAVALADESLVITWARLVITSPETGTSFETEAVSVSGNAALFTITFESDSDATNYELTSFTYTLDGSDQTYYIGLDVEEGNYVFDVVSAETMEVLESDTSDSEDVTVYTVSDDGALTATEEIVTTLSVATASVSSSAAYASVSTDVDAEELVIALDPGHGGSDGGSSGNGLTESELNWTIMTYCKAELEEYANVTVVVTKTESETVKSLETRVSRAVEYGADVIVSLHCNTGGGNGSEVWVPNSSGYLYSLHTIGEDLGESILEQLVALGLTDRGVKTRNSTSSTYSDGSTADYYGIIRYAREAGIVGIIIEHAFLDNSSDAAFLKKESNLKKLGIADATGIANYYGLTKIGTPTLSSVTVSDSLTSATLTWTKADNADGYVIYRSTDGSTYSKLKTITSGSTLTYTDSTLEMGSTYYYKIRAYSTDSSGAKSYGEYSSVKKVTAKPSTVTISSAVTGDDYCSVTLNWTALSNADGYQIRRLDDDGSYVTVATITDASVTSWTDTDVERGNTYTYKIRAYKTNSSGTKIYGSYSSTIDGLTKPDTTTLSSVTLASSLTKATIKWTKVSGAAGYEIYRATGSGSYSKIATITSGSTVSYTDSGLSLGKTYKYKVRAYGTYTETTTVTVTEQVLVESTSDDESADASGDASGDGSGDAVYEEITYEQEVTTEGTVYGSFSSASSVTTKPSTVTISSASTTTAGYVKVSWKKVSNATGYVIYRSTNGGSYSKVKTISSNSTVSWTDTSVKPGRVYRYKIRAYKKSGSTTVYSSSYSSVKKVTAKPGKVTISSITSTKKRSGTVKWAKIKNATGYQVAYRIKGTSKWYYTTVSTNKKVFTLLRNKKYYVKVRAYTKYNGTKYYGSWSSEKLMTVK